jgi:uncharacterized protein YbjT (DUF2867 family)
LRIRSAQLVVYTSMRVFVTGGSGFVGSKVVAELLAHGHTVLALARSEDAAAKLKAAGAEVLRGSLEDLDSLITGANLRHRSMASTVHDNLLVCCATCLFAVRFCA